MAPPLRHFPQLIGDTDMTKTTTRTTRTNKATRAEKAIQAAAASKRVVFDVPAWAARLNDAALSFTAAGQQLLMLVIEARGQVEPDTARERITEAFASAYAYTYDVPYEEAAKCKTVKNRVSDAMAVFKAETLPENMPAHLQAAASACRRANGPKRAPRQPAGGKAENTEKAGTPVTPLAMLSLALEGLRLQAADNEYVLEMIAEMTDLAADVANALADTRGGDVIDGEVIEADVA